MEESDWRVRPIGYAHTPHHEKRDAPRQAVLSTAVGTIELLAGCGFEHAIEDIAGWQYIWVIYWFDRAQGFRPKVRPPRSNKNRGVFATRSPHRPNPIGMSAVELLGVERLTLHVGNLDLLDGTPVLDIKPYVPYSDAFPSARCGWLEEEAERAEVLARGGRPADPFVSFVVAFTPQAEDQLLFIHQQTQLDLRAMLIANLMESPEPRPYRRIRRHHGHSVIAVKEWRAVFVVEGRQVNVVRLYSGYRESELLLVGRPELDVHRTFVETFGPNRDG